MKMISKKALLIFLVGFIFVSILLIVKAGLPIPSGHQWASVGIDISLYLIGIPILLVSGLGYIVSKKLSLATGQNFSILFLGASSSLILYCVIYLMLFHG